MAKEIVVVIAQDGSTSVEGEGFSGPACDLVLRELAEALGAIEEVRKKPEYYAAQVVKQAAKAGG